MNHQRFADGRPYINKTSDGIISEGGKKLSIFTFSLFLSWDISVLNDWAVHAQWWTMTYLKLWLTSQEHLNKASQTGNHSVLY